MRGMLPDSQRTIVTYVCPFDSSPEHWELKCSTLAQKENIEDSMKRHLDKAHPGWTNEEVVAAGAKQRAEDKNLDSAGAVYAQASNQDAFRDITGVGVKRPWL